MGKEPKVVVKKVLDWDTIGQFIKILLDLFTIIRREFVAAEIGIKIIPWLVGEGKQFTNEALAFLSERYWATQLVRPTKDRNVIYVNLDAPLKMPFDGAEAVENPGRGWVKVELKKGSLYVNGKKILAYLDERQKDGVMLGTKLAEALTGKSVEHPNILDALMEHPHLIPDEFKQDGQGRTIYIFFWAVKFRNRHRDSSLYVRGGCWRDGVFHSGYRWLDSIWDERLPAAVRER